MKNNYQFVRNDREDTYGNLKLQDKILEIMVYIDQFCKEHNITYYLMGGSALGAIRHQGFIPWDDDMDIFMRYDDYERFLKLCETELDTERFYLQREDTDELPYFFSKLRMNGTTCIDETQINRKNMHQGIFVDIMCLDQAAPKGWKRMVQYVESSLLRASALAKLSGYHPDSTTKKMAMMISRIFVKGAIKDALLRDVRKYNHKSAEDYAHLFCKANYSNAFYEKELFRTMRYVPFEQVQLAVSNGVEKYLEIRYGEDYMQIPSEETKAKYQVHAMIWDTEKNYTEYVK